jgi:hypothetical protein
MFGWAAAGLTATTVALGALAVWTAPNSTSIDPNVPPFDTIPMTNRMFAQNGGTLEYVADNQCFALRNDVEMYSKNGTLYAREAVRRVFLILPTGTRAGERDGEIELVLPEGDAVRTGDVITVGGGFVDAADFTPPLRCTGAERVFLTWTAEQSGPSPWQDRMREAARTGLPLS